MLRLPHAPTRACRLTAALATVLLHAVLLDAAALPAPEAVSSVRIRLLELNAPRAVTVAADDAGLLVFAGEYEDPIARLEAGESARLTVSNRQVHVEIGGRGLYAASLRLVPGAGGTQAVTVAEGKTPSRTFHYPGTLQVDPDEAATGELRLVNDVDLETYVGAVIAREYGFDDREGARAMAVIIRTYTLASLGKYGADYDLMDHTMSQVYQGVEGVSPAFFEAARLTRGEVLTYGGNLIDAVYFSSSGGHTADNETVWQGAAVPYLRGRPDPYDSGSPYQAWKSTVSRSRLLALLSKTYGFDVAGFHLGERGPDDRVQTIYLLKQDDTRHPIRGNDFRMLVLRHFGAEAIRSTNFTARRVGETYAFTGRGNGHGVGLSQWGAHELAVRGKSYREILAFYYTGVRLAPLDAPGRPVHRAEAPGRAEPAARPEATAPRAPAARVATKETTPLPPAPDRIGW